MQIIKKSMYVFVCCLIVTLSFVLPVYGQDGFAYTPADLLDLGFEYDESGNLFYTGPGDPFDRGISLFDISTPNYPNFNVLTDVPWSSFPQYIKDILNLSMDGLSASEGTPFQLPFFLIVINNNTMNMYAGINVGLGQSNLSALYSYIFTYTSSSVSSVYPYSICYQANYNLGTMEYTMDWTKLSSSAWGDKGILYSYTPNSLITNSTPRDLYFYGANGVAYASKYSSLAIPYNSSNANQLVTFRLSPLGFNNGDIVPSPGSFPYVYFKNFTPPSQETINQGLLEEQNEKLDNIIDASGNQDFSSTLPDSAIGDYGSAEDDLFNNYSPSELEDDFNIEYDSNVFKLAFDLISYWVQYLNAEVFTFFISMLSLGVIALLLNR